MEVETIMSREVVTVDLGTTLQTISHLFKRQAIQQVLVVEEGEVLGIVTTYDIVNALSPFLNTMSERERDVRTLKKRAHHIMTRDVVSILRDTSIAEATKLLVEHNISCLPVVSKSFQEDKVVTIIEGMVTRNHIFNYFLTTHTQE